MPNQSEASQKARKRELGAYYTPTAIAEQLVEWAVRTPGDTVLDPSFGSLSFLEAARDRLAALGQTQQQAARQLFGVEVDGDAFVDAARRSRARGEAPMLVRADFLSMQPDGRLQPTTAVVGNPPYLRFQGFTDRRRSSTGSQLHLPVELTGLASSWAVFLVHAVHFVAPDGRLGHVVPAQFLHAQYADAVRAFLSRQFARITVIAFEERVFPAAQEEVVLVCAEGRGAGPSAFDFRSVKNLARLNVPRLCAPRTRSPKRIQRGKLLAQLLPASTRQIYASAEQDSRVVRLGGLAGVHIGIVTGANSFFLVPDATARQYPPVLFAPAIGKVAHVRGARLTRRDFCNVVESGASCRLLLADARLDDSVLATLGPYVQEGEAIGLHERRKCRERRPWWELTLPREPIPDMFLTYCTHHHPRLVLNDARVMHTNSLHGVVLPNPASASALAASFYNSLTMLSAELLGRSYGGGVLKLEPTEAEALLLPLAAEVHEADGTLLGHVDHAVRAGDLNRAQDLIDPIVLIRGLGMTPSDVTRLREAAARLRARRHARGRVART